MALSFCRSMRAELVGLAARFAVGDDLQRGDAGRGGQRVAVEGAGVLHLRLAGTEVENLHDVGPARQAAARQTAGQDLGHGRQIGLDVVKALGAAGMDAKTADDLIENQQAIVLRGDVAQGLEEFAAHRHLPEMAAGRLDDDAADLRIAGQGLFDAPAGSFGGMMTVVVRDLSAGSPGTDRGSYGGSDGGDEEIVPAVEMAGELQHLRLAGVDARTAAGPSASPRCRS